MTQVFIKGLLRCCRPLWWVGQFAVVCFGINSGVMAAPQSAETEQVKAQLVASVDKVSAGDQILVAVQLQMIPHWHTYWRNPGDSGTATTIVWQLPAGASAGDILWPFPSRSSLGPVTNYSYSDEVTLPSEIQIPKDLAVGAEFAITAKVEWLVCREECIPQQADLGLILPVVAPSEPRGSGSPLISAAMAKLPKPNPWKVSLDPSVAGLQLRVALPQDQKAGIKDAWFYPYDWGRINQSLAQVYRVTPEGFSLDLTPGEAPLKPGQPLSGVLVLTELSAGGERQQAFSIETPSALNPPATGVAVPALGLFSALALAFLGGMVLNLMPCVLPVLSLKALGLVQQAGMGQRIIRLQGWAYTLGVVASFILLALGLILLKAGGAQIGWGFQFQSPLFVLALVYLLFAVGLSLSGLVELGGSMVGVGSGLANRSGLSGSFFTGVLATLVATPCTAPFMAAALGYALGQPPLPLLAVFVCLGVGLAFPYLLLSHWPNLQRWLPKPGLWMERLKQFFAFPMYGACIWLVWVLALQAGALGVVLALSGLLAIAFAAWLFNSTQQATKTWRVAGAGLAAGLLLLAIGGSFWSLKGQNQNSTPVASVPKHWEAYSPERLQTLLAAGKPVFLNFTAAWCISCLANERVALSNRRVIEAFSEAGITYLKGDWTNQDANITAMLKQFGRSGVPLYLWYAPGVATPVELPQILTPDIVLEMIGKGEAAAGEGEKVGNIAVVQDIK